MALPSLGAKTPYRKRTAIPLAPIQELPARDTRGMSLSVGEIVDAKPIAEPETELGGPQPRFGVPPPHVCRFVYDELAPADSRSVPSDRDLPTAVHRLVYALVYRQMHAVARRRDQDLGELVQAVATRALRSLPRFDCASRVSTWTWTICIRTLRDHDRALASIVRRMRRAVGLQPPECLPSISTPHEDQEQRERWQHLCAALDQLTQAQRTVVVLYYVEDMRIDEIAEVLSTPMRHVPPKTVQSRLSGARARLRQLLVDDPYFGDSACATPEEAYR